MHLDKDCQVYIEKQTKFLTATELASYVPVALRTSTTTTSTTPEKKKDTNSFCLFCGSWGLTAGIASAALTASLYL